MSDVTDTAEVGRRRGESEGPERVVDAALAQELVDRAREQGVELLGENGLLRAMTKAVLERGLAERLTEHLRTSRGFLTEARNVVLLGPPGTGKAHLATGLGIAAANHGHRVPFAIATEWVTRLCHCCGDCGDRRDRRRRRDAAPPRWPHAIRSGVRTRSVNRQREVLAADENLGQEPWSVAGARPARGGRRGRQPVAPVAPYLTPLGVPPPITRLTNLAGHHN